MTLQAPFQSFEYNNKKSWGGRKERRKVTERGEKQAWRAHSCNPNTQRAEHAGGQELKAIQSCMDLWREGRRGKGGAEQGYGEGKEKRHSITLLPF